MEGAYEFPILPIPARHGQCPRVFLVALHDIDPTFSDSHTVPLELSGSDERSQRLVGAEGRQLGGGGG